MRPIDADVYENEIWKLRRNYQLMDDTHTADKIMHGLYRAEQALKEAPTLDVRPMVHGHWVVATENFAPELVCSVCGVRFPYVAGCCMESKMHFCPNCGNPMDEKEEE